MSDHRKIGRGSDGYFEPQLRKDPDERHCSIRHLLRVFGVEHEPHLYSPLDQTMSSVRRAV